ncbi:MAG: transposase [Lachnospiraceae bacterium]
MSRKRISTEMKQEILRKHLEEGRSVQSLCDEYFLGHSTIERWVTEYRKECQEKPEQKAQLDIFEENRRLQKQIEELKKENSFLKKAAAFFAKEIE